MKYGYGVKTEPVFELKPAFLPLKHYYLTSFTPYFLPGKACIHAGFSFVFRKYCASQNK